MQTLKKPLAGLLGVLCTQLELFAPLLLLVAAALALDYVTGVLGGMRAGGLDSATAARGLYKKAGFLLLLLFGFFLDVAIPWFMDAGLSVTLPFSLPFGMILAAWIVLTESISIVENLAGLGVTVPAWLGKLLRVTREKVGKDE